MVTHESYIILSSQWLTDCGCIWIIDMETVLRDSVPSTAEIQVTSLNLFAEGGYSIELANRARFWLGALVEEDCLRNEYDDEEDLPELERLSEEIEVVRYALENDPLAFFTRLCDSFLFLALLFTCL